MIASTLIAAAVAAPLAAEQAVAQPPIVVTASRIEQSIVDSLAAVSIIDRDEIERSVAQDLHDLLRLQPGVDVVRSGGPGTQTSVFLRGTNSNHVLVLIDGIRVSSVVRGTFNWENLPLAQIERIEIVRGPRASLYGSDAIGGVIEITTRTADHFGASVQLGSFETRRGSAWFGTEGSTGHFSAALSGDRVEGFSAQNPGGFAYDPDDDGYRNAALSTRFGDAFGETHRFSGLILSSQGETEFDQGSTEQENLLAAVRVEGQLAPTLSHSIQLSYAEDDLDTPAFGSNFRSDRTTLDWLLRYPQASGDLLFGVNLMSERGSDNDTIGGVRVYGERRDNAGLFASYLGDFAAHRVEASVRYDDNSEFGGETTGSAAWGYAFNPQWRAQASIGTAFRGPSLSEQYAPGFFGLFAGNPDLEPERSTAAELGLRYTGIRHAAFANLFRTDIDDLIAFAGTDFQAINLDEARIEGLELGWSFASERYLANVTATLQDAEDRTSGNRLLRRPDEKVSARVERFFERFRVGAEVLYSGDRDDIGGVELGDYTVLNLTGGWSISDQWRIDARIENLFDEEYELAQGFNTQERSAFVSVVFNP